MEKLSSNRANDTWLEFKFSKEFRFFSKLITTHRILKTLFVLDKNYKSSSVLNHEGVSGICPESEFYNIVKRRRNGKVIEYKLTHHALEFKECFIETIKAAKRMLYHADDQCQGD